MSGPTPKPKHTAHDPFLRGVKQTNPLGTTLFVLIRAADPLLQYLILSKDLFTPLLSNHLGLRVLSDTSLGGTGVALVDALSTRIGLGPYRLVLLALCTLGTLKQIHWALFTNQDKLRTSSAVQIGFVNTFLNTIKTLLGVLAFSSPGSSSSFPQGPIVLGSTMFLTGLFLEAGSEYQRSRFKKDKRNAGKAYTGGLWTLARHINYTGFALWKGGHAMASAGYVFGGAVTGLFVLDLASRAVPQLDEYCTKRYGAQWLEFKKRTPYIMIPGIL